MSMVKPNEGKRTEVAMTSKTRLYVGSVGYKIENTEQEQTADRNA
jgi:hypothetical protein